MKVRKGHEKEKLYSYTLSLDGKPIAKVVDEDWGSGTSIDFLGKEQEAIMQEFVSAGNWKHRTNEIIFDKKEINKTLLDVTESLADVALFKFEMAKEKIKIDKLCLKAIVFGTIQHYGYVSFKSIKTLPELMKYSNGITLLQESVDKVNANLKKGEVIFNSPEQLQALGITIKSND